jgi:hypothetical protein
VAQASVPFAEIEELDSDELEILQDEIAHRWKHPFALYATVFVCSIGAAVQYGFPESSAGGAGRLTCQQRLGSNWFQRGELVVSCRIRHRLGIQQGLLDSRAGERHSVHLLRGLVSISVCGLQPIMTDESEVDAGSPIPSIT